MADEPLGRVIAALNASGVEYMLTGSYASNVYGRVRSTFDADLVVALESAQLSRLLESLGQGFYTDARTMKEIREAGGQFNAVHKTSGLKIDFYLPRDAHDRETLGRRRMHRLWGQAVPVISPEDLILAKLLWAREGGSARQVEDARGVYEVQKDRLDLAYLKARAETLSIQESLRAILK